MKKLAIGMFGAALLFAAGTAVTLRADTVLKGTVPQSEVRQVTVQSADRSYAGRNNICRYAGTFRNYYNCGENSRYSNYQDEDQNGVCDHYEAGGRFAGHGKGYGRHGGCRR